MACHICFRTDVRKRPRAGKQHFPHKCPHGVWCVSGDRLLGTHANNTPIAGPNRCVACRDAARTRALAVLRPPTGRTVVRILPSEGQ